MPRWPILLALVWTSLAWTSLAWADALAPVASPERHAPTGIQVRARPLDVPVPVRDAAREAALSAVATHVACVCDESGQLHIDPSRSLRATECGCPVAQRVRDDLEQSLASLTTPELADKRKLAETLEAAFVPRRAEYERVWRTPEVDYAWFMDHVRCICEGCKPTVFFSKCQLGCTPGNLYKLRARIFLGLGFSRDELLDYYLAEVNAHRSSRDQVTRDFLLPHLQRERGWLVPLLVLAGALLLVYGAVRRWSRRTTLAQAPEPMPLTDEARARVLRALEDDDGR